MKPLDPITEEEARELAEKPFNASDEKDVNEARKRSGRKKKRQREILKVMMGNEDGRTLMFDFVRCVIEGDPMVPGDQYSTYYNLGQERKARALFREIVKICPEEFVKMMKEQKV